MQKHLRWSFLVSFVVPHQLFFLSCPLQASKWCDDGIYLLASQLVDKCQSHEGAELALQELERYLDNAGQNRLTDLSTIWTDYEAVLNQQLRVRRPTQELMCCILNIKS